MKTHFSSKEQKYDGAQLRPLFGYMNFELLGDSIVSWVGECDIPFAHMVDGEDVLARSEIRGAKMVHFIVEKFDVDLYAAVGLQRLCASLAIDVLRAISPKKEMTDRLRRDGDDIYLDRAAKNGAIESQKLSISIATKSITSTLIHFAVNVVNEGTPVLTLSLKDLEVLPEPFARELMARFAREATTISEATRKVCSV